MKQKLIPLAVPSSGLEVHDPKDRDNPGIFIMAWRRLNLSWKFMTTFIALGLLSLGFTALFCFIRNDSGFIGNLLPWVFWMSSCLVLLSLIGTRFTSSIKELTSWARGYMGKTPRWPFKGQDEIDELTRSLYDLTKNFMSEQSELIDRANVMEAMNSIDKAVLRDSSRVELLASVFKAIGDYTPFRYIAVAARHPDGSGFQIIAWRMWGDTKIDQIDFVPDSLLPSNLLVRFTDYFETPLEELGQNILSSIFKGKLEKNLLFTYLPFNSSSSNAGSLIIIRSSATPSIDRLKLLSDQVGVAYKDLSIREDRERNWLAVVSSLSRAIDAKSAWTRGHSQRVASTARSLGSRLMMDFQELTTIEIAAVLHDVGKIGVPEAILEKAGCLQAFEYEIIQSHPAIGASIVEDIPEYAAIKNAILHHHERWDGTGYPQGLNGEAIPLYSRIIAIADVYDAITSDRPYRKKMSYPEARDFIAQGAGSLFDPCLTRIFLEDISTSEQI